MFSALKRRKDDEIDAQEWTYRVTRDLLKQLASGVVKGSDVDIDWLRLKIGELKSRQERGNSPEELLELLEQAMAHLQEYNIATARHFHRQLTELESAFTLLTRTLRWAREENEAQANRFSSLQQMLDRAAAAGDPNVMKSRLAESIAHLREDSGRQKRQFEQAVGDLQDEVNKCEARRQREAGKTARPLKMSGMKAHAGQSVAEAPAPEAQEEKSPPAGTQAELPPAAPVTLPLEEGDDEDPTTGLPGRLHGENALSQAVAEKQPMFAVMVSIERLSMIEERYGEQLRDDVLVHFGLEYAQAMGPEDQLFRWGRFSFLALLKRTGSKEWVQMETDRKFSARYKKTIVANGRSVLLNMGATWKMWSIVEARSFEELRGEITAYAPA